MGNGMTKKSALADEEKRHMGRFGKEMYDNEGLRERVSAEDRKLIDDLVSDSALEVIYRATKFACLRVGQQHLPVDRGGYAKGAAEVLNYLDSAMTSQRSFQRRMDWKERLASLEAVAESPEEAEAISEALHKGWSKDGELAEPHRNSPLHPEYESPESSLTGPSKDEEDEMDWEDDEDEEDAIWED